MGVSWEISRGDENFLVIFVWILCTYRISCVLRRMLGNEWTCQSNIKCLCSQMHFKWVPHSQSNLFNLLFLNGHELFLKTMTVWYVSINVVYNHVPWLLMKGVVSLRDLQSLGKSQQHLSLPGHLPVLDFCMCWECNFAIQDEWKVWGFQQGLALSFAGFF